MLFRITLWIISLRFWQLGKFNDSFRYKIAAANAVIQFQSFDGRVCRYFEFRDGRVRSRGCAHPLSARAATAGPLGLPVMIFAFDTPGTGVQILQESKTDPSALLRNVQTKRVRIVGDKTLLVWFGEISAYL